MYQVANAPVRQFPFPHFFAEDVFSAELFSRLRHHLPSTDVYRPLADSGRVIANPNAGRNPYADRFTIDFQPEHFARMQPDDRAAWTNLADWLLGADFMLFVLSKFDALLRQRFGDALNTITFTSRAELVRDVTNYSLGPHSDHPSKVVVILFYLPATADAEHLGTSVYVAHDPAAHEDTGVHHDRSGFSCAATMPFRPNCAMGFFKTPNSFHGVEPVSGPSEQRDLIQFSITYNPAPA